MTVYLLIAILLFVGIQISNNLLMTWLAISVNTLLVGVFVAYLVKKDFPLSSIPIIGKKFKK
jgi:nitrogen fixation protein FixH